MYPVLCKIGPVTIYSVGLLWAFAAFVAVWIVRLELKRYGYDPKIAAGIVTAAAIGGIAWRTAAFHFERGGYLNEKIIITTHDKRRTRTWLTRLPTPAHHAG